MKLLFAYFDFDGARGMRDCGLNFSTDERYYVIKTVVESAKAAPKKQYHYSLMRKETQEREPLPADFWGDPRLSNLTALVGKNGEGKSTLLHALIAALVDGLAPGVPFLLLLEKTASGSQSGEKIVYCDGGGRDAVFKCSNVSGAPEPTRSYPAELRKAKVALIDNTLSVSSKLLDRQYGDLLRRSSLSEAAGSPGDGCLQLYNRSLFSSICHSNAVSAAGKNLDPLSASGMLTTHFQYETYQELRVLFDRSHRDIMTRLKGKGLPVPNPTYVFVYMEGFFYLQQDYFPGRSLSWARGIEEGEKFLNRFCGGVVLSMYDRMLRCLEPRANKEGMDLDEALTEIFSDPERTVFQIADIIRIAELWRDWLERGLFSQKSDGVIKRYLELAFFLEENQLRLNQMFVSSSDQNARFERGLNAERDRSDFCVNIEDTLTHTDRLECMMDFLQRYRDISDYVYFLVFSAGLSSGEKNILRMLTQLRYALVSPDSGQSGGEERDSHKKGQTANVLKNILPDGKTEICDSIFLFFDEADLTYHPDWQRQFVYILTEYLPLLYKETYSNLGQKKGCKDIQVILATHSPLLLSNIPVQSCIFLKRGDTDVSVLEHPPIQQTFGANIHDLLNNAFFLESTVGAFAYQKIIQIFDKLNSIREGKALPEDWETARQYKRTIDLIGDPIIHTKMLNLYQKCFPPERNVRKALEALSDAMKFSAEMTAEELDKNVALLERALAEFRNQKEENGND